MKGKRSNNEQTYHYGQKWVRLHEIAGKPKEAYVVSKLGGEPVIMSVHWPFVWGTHPTFKVNSSILFKHWRAASKGVQGELFDFKRHGIIEHWKNKHLK